MKINTDEITNVLKQEVQRYSTQLEVSQVGQVIEVGDGIARIYGLSNAMASEMLHLGDVLVSNPPVTVGKNQQGEATLPQRGISNPAAAKALLDLFDPASEMANEFTGCLLVFAEETAEGRLPAAASLIGSRVPDLRHQGARTPGIFILPTLIDKNHRAHAYRIAAGRRIIPGQDSRGKDRTDRQTQENHYLWIHLSTPPSRSRAGSPGRLIFPPGQP